MSLLCGRITHKEYYVEVYLSSAGYTSNMSSVSENPEPLNNNNTPQKGSQAPNKITPGFSPNTARSFPSSLHQQFNNSTSTQDSISPQQFMQNFGVPKIKRIRKEEIGQLLSPSYSEKMGFNRKQREVFRMIKKSEYAYISRLDYKDGKWKDQSFDTPKIYVDHYNNQKILPIRWERVEEWTAKVIKKKPRFMDPYIVATDVMQGSIVGDCYFLSAVASLASRPQRILRLFSSIELNNNGVYMARLMFKGIFQEVVIDDLFPVIADNDELIGCRPCWSGNEIYVMVLEKCWAKLWQSYEAIDGGYPHQALHALSGAPTKNYPLCNETNTRLKSESFFNQLHSYFRKGFVMCAGTLSSTSGKATVHHKDQGIIQIKIQKGHVYCVQQMLEYDDGESKEKQKMVKIFNPWGYNDDQNEQVLIKGEICISWQQFLRNFSYVTVCKIRDNAHHLYTELQNCKINCFTFVELNVFQNKSGYFAVTLSETDKKEKTGSYLVVTYVVLKVFINPKTKEEEYEFKTIRTEAEFPDHYLELNDMSEGKYMIGIYFSEVEVKENLTFGIYSEDVFGFAQKKMSIVFQQNFLYNMFQSYNKNISASSLSHLQQNHDVWTSLNFMVNGSIFSYYLLRVGKTEKQPYQLTIKSDVFSNNFMKAWEPYNTQQIKMIANPGFETIVIFTLYSLKQYKNSKKKLTSAIHPKGTFLNSK